MKKFSEENYYELLELTPRATSEQIQIAYEHAKKTFAEDSLAIYSLFATDDRRQLLERIERAYRVLMNESSRRQYDLDTGLIQNSGPSVNSSPSALPPERVTNLPEPLTGKTLKNIREHRGISLDDISSRTRIHLPYLQFIEEDRPEKLPHLVYLRGYLTQYAQVIGLDPSRVVHGYLKNCTKNPEQK
jgi:flagellar biosynthesis protein FlhG